MKEQIENPWCVYDGGEGPIRFGKIVKIERGILYIRDSERFEISDPWEEKYVKRFGTLEEAVKYYIKNLKEGDSRMDRPLREEQIQELARTKFPSYFKGRK